MSKITSSVDNLYQLDGRVPMTRALPVGLQHILAMFVSNLMPITILATAAGLSVEETSVLLRNAMLIAGIATLIQLYPVWKVGARLPIVMGMSSKFIPVLYTIAEVYGYPSMIGAVIVGGIFEGIIGLFARYWRRIISPVVASAVVMSIGLSLFSVAARSFGGGYGDDFGSAQNWILGMVTLAVCLAWSCLTKGYWKHLSILVGLVVGYILAICMGKVDFSGIFAGGFIALPKILPYAPEFHIEAIIPVCVIFIVSAAETIGDTSAMTSAGLNRDIQDKEISGALACDGFLSSVSALMGCPALTSFSQNAGIVAMTKVVNRFTVMIGSGILILAGLFPPIANFFLSIPSPVLGGCTLIIFGNIFALGIEMFAKAGLNQRNITIIALSFAIGVGFTATEEIALWTIFPDIIYSVFASNIISVVFVVAVILNLVLPKGMETEQSEY